ncbi:hypothetical protein [Acidocella sp.]|uniref:hypothetical protein n=1 Tax=Acidocella sp. TaxID=50710 RepID=UPI002631E729|nr:hypothetical protein [Acidocella sp.]
MPVTTPSFVGENAIQSSYQPLIERHTRNTGQRGTVTVCRHASSFTLEKLNNLDLPRTTLANGNAWNPAPLGAAFDLQMTLNASVVIGSALQPTKMGS